jgi:hypothetical protein
VHEEREMVHEDRETVHEEREMVHEERETVHEEREIIHFHVQHRLPEGTMCFKKNKNGIYIRKWQLS